MTELFNYISAEYNYIVCALLMLIGFFTVVVSHNLVKKLMGLMIFQTSVLLIYISASYVHDAQIPILKDGVDNYVNPLPHVLMLTAIVVGVATIASGLAIVVRIKEEYGTIEDDEIINHDVKGYMQLENPEIRERD
jgi:multicomponent Na+:H+ antiporter subunit C